MTHHVDLVEHFRQIITTRYTMYAWVTAIASGVFLLILLLPGSAGFASSLISMACAMSIGLFIRNLKHREKMLEHLKLGQNDDFISLESYLEAKQDLWQKNLWTRWTVGVFTGIVMLFLLLFHADPYWSMTVASLFIILILAVAILGWINFNDQLLLQDIRRSHRDQPSSKPE